MCLFCLFLHLFYCCCVFLPVLLCDVASKCMAESSCCFQVCSKNSVHWWSLGSKKSDTDREVTIILMLLLMVLWTSERLSLLLTDTASEFFFSFCTCCIVLYSQFCKFPLKVFLWLLRSFNLVWAFLIMRMEVSCEIYIILGSRLQDFMYEEGCC